MEQSFKTIPWFSTHILLYPHLNVRTWEVNIYVINMYFDYTAITMNKRLLWLFYLLIKSMQQFHKKHLTPFPYNILKLISHSRNHWSSNKSHVFLIHIFLIPQINSFHSITPRLCDTDIFWDRNYSNFMLLIFLVVIILQDFESLISSYAISAFHNRKSVF